MDTSNVSNKVSSRYAMNMAIFLNVHIEWTTHHFRAYMTLLKDGIIEYIQGNESSPNNSGNKSFFIQHGDISTEIHLACALRYFAGGSYLDITMSHVIGVTDFYLSIWAIVDAMNRCPLLQFQFPTTISECQTISTEFSSRSKAGFNNCIGCIDGLLIWLEKPSQNNANKLVLIVANFTVVLG